MVTLNFFQMAYTIRKFLFPAKRRYLGFDAKGEQAASLIRERIIDSKPCMIGRLGATELAGILSVWDMQDQSPAWKKQWDVFIGERRAVDRWNPRIRRHMAEWSGFFPLTDEALNCFAKHMECDMAELDILGSWLPEENRVQHLFSHAKIIPVQDLRPEQHSPPWSQALKGMKVLVIHPFETSIHRQYKKRRLLFSGREILPNFELLTLKAPQTLGGISDRFVSWFDALEWLCLETDKIDFDVAIIGAGAYGFPLAAHIKRLGRKAIHLGGATQIMFGIMGNRWKNDKTLKPFINEHWTIPTPEETPMIAGKVEDACYW